MLNTAAYNIGPEVEGPVFKLALLFINSTSLFYFFI
jgi:hypothetical protein